MDYKETTVSGTSWQRSWRGNAEKPPGQSPSIQFHEEIAINVGDKVITQPVGLRVNVMFNPENPLHVTAYTTLNAIYIEEREKLDTPPVVVEQITTPVVLKEEPTPVEVVPVIAEETPAKPEPTMEG